MGGIQVEPDFYLLMYKSSKLRFPVFYTSPCPKQLKYKKYQDAKNEKVNFDMNHPVPGY